MCTLARKLFCPYIFFFQAEDGIRDPVVTGVQTCALPIWIGSRPSSSLISLSGRLPIQLPFCWRAGSRALNSLTTHFPGTVQGLGDMASGAGPLTPTTLLAGWSGALFFPPFFIRTRDTSTKAKAVSSRERFMRLE